MKGPDVAISKMMGVITAVSSLSLMPSCVKNVTKSRGDIAQISQEEPAVSHQTESQTGREVSSCTYTGVILMMEDDNHQPVIKIENICLEQTESDLVMKEGRHQVVRPDSQGQYPIPFHNAYLVIRDNKPYIVYEDEKGVVTAAIKHVGGAYYTFEGIAIEKLRPIVDESWLH